MRRSLTKEGEILIRELVIKSIAIKCFSPGNKNRHRFTVRSPNGRRFTEDGIEKILQQVADDLEKKFPTHEYRLVPVGPAAFNFVWECEREALQQSA